MPSSSPVSPSSRHSLLLLLRRCTSPPTLHHHQFKQIHAQFITTGFSFHTFPLSVLFRAAAATLNPPSLAVNYSLSLLSHSPKSSTAFLSNTLISSFASRGLIGDALLLYARRLITGPPPNAHTFPSLLKACSCFPSPLARFGFCLHAHVLKFVTEYKDRFINAALLGFYSKCGYRHVCRYLFDEIPDPDLPAWNTLLTSLSRFCSDQEPDYGVINGVCMEILERFLDLQCTSVAPNEITLVAVISACSQLGALCQGIWAHAYCIRRHNLSVNQYVSTSLIEMYSKCGRLDIAEQVFDRLPERDTLCYNAMIRGLAVHGCGRRALQLFDKMTGEGVGVDDVTFVATICACAHAGLVDEGHSYLTRMQVDYGIEPKVEHYGCMVDLLGRAGKLEEAEWVIHEMPMEPNAVIYRSLLAACRVQNNMEISKRIVANLIQLEPEHGGNYVITSNMYANINKWSDVREMRKAMKVQEINKTPGSSLVEVNGAIHEFLIADKTHPYSKEIYAMMDEMNRRLLEFGHESKHSRGAV